MDEAVWAFIQGCEVVDYVVNPDGTRDVRRQNMAANNELARRDPVNGQDRWGGLSPSGESTPYAIAWVDTCTGADIEVVDPPFYAGPYGWGWYAASTEASHEDLEPEPVPAGHR
jgi:hypothetical protein